MSEIPATKDKQSKALTITVIIALLFGAYFLRGYFLLVVISAILVYLFNPIYQRLRKHTKHKSAAATLTFIFMLLVFIIPLTLIVLATISQAKHLVDIYSANPNYNLGHLGESALDTTNGLISKIPGLSSVSHEQLVSAVNSTLQALGKSIVNALTELVASIPVIVTRFIIFIYVFLALMVHQETVIETLQRLNPLGRRVGELYLRKAGAMTTAMAKGQFVIAFLDGLTDATLMYIAGFHNIFFFMLILLTFLSFIPLGGGIIVIPLGIVMILTGHIWQGLLLVLGHILITSNIDNVMRPRFVPKSAYLNPALTMLSVFAGVGMFGFLGVIVGPIIMILIISTIDVYLEASRRHVETPKGS